MDNPAIAISSATEKRVTAMVTNIHTRDLHGTREQVSELMASLSSDDDRLWPHQWWPAMRFDRALQTGAVGGHGPIRYVVDTYIPAEKIVFRFTAPRGFNGTHAYFIEPVDATRTRLTHILDMHPTRTAHLSWILVYRPLHDALIEDSLNCAEAHLTGHVPQHNTWSPYVRFLRWFFTVALSRRRKR